MKPEEARVLTAIQEKPGDSTTGVLRRACQGHEQTYAALSRLEGRGLIQKERIPNRQGNPTRRWWAA